MTMKVPREGVQVLRGHMVRRVPTRAEIASRPSFALTDRDREILAAVYAHGFLTAELIEIAFFPRQTDRPASPSSSAHERLRLLWLWSYVDRVELPIAPALGGRRPFLYALGSRGVPVVTDRLGAGARLVQQRRLGRLDDRSIEHDLVASRFWADLYVLLADAPRENIRRWCWTSERDLRALHLRADVPHARFGAAFVPDGHFAITYADGLIHAGIVEVDTGTLPLRRFRRKLRIFEAARRQGIFERQWAHLGASDFEVYVLAPSPGRIQHLRAAARAEVGDEWWSRYYFGDFSVLEPDRFDDAWWPLDADDPSDTYGVLFDRAWEGRREATEQNVTPEHAPPVADAQPNRRAA